MRGRERDVSFLGRDSPLMRGRDRDVSFLRARRPLDEGPGQRCLVFLGETAPWWRAGTEMSRSSGRDSSLMRAQERDISFLGARRPLDEGPGQRCLVPQGKRAPWWWAGTEMSRSSGQSAPWWGPRTEISLSSGRDSPLMWGRDRDVSFLGARAPASKQLSRPGRNVCQGWHTTRYILIYICNKTFQQIDRSNFRHPSSPKVLFWKLASLTFSLDGFASII